METRALWDKEVTKMTGWDAPLKDEQRNGLLDFSRRITSPVRFSGKGAERHHASQAHDARLYQSERYGSSREPEQKPKAERSETDLAKRLLRYAGSYEEERDRQARATETSQFGEGAS